MGWFKELFPTSQSAFVLQTVNLVFGSNCLYGCLVNIIYNRQFGCTRAGVWEGVLCFVKKVNDTTHNSTPCWTIATSSTVVKITQHLFLEPA